MTDGAAPAGGGAIEQDRPDPAGADLFRAFADNLPTLAWIANADGYIVWYNRRWHDYCGTTPAQMEGWGWQAVHEPGALPTVVERWTHCIATGEPFEMIFPLRGADGVFRPFLTRSEPCRDETGRVARWFGTNVDVSAQAAAEQAEHDARSAAEALAAERAAILGQLAEGVIVTDCEGRISFVNEAAERLHGVARLDVPPDRYSETYHLLTESGEPYPPHDLPLARAVRGETVTEARWRIARPDGTEVLAIGGARPLRDEAGARIGAVLTLRDDTARDAAERRLRELNETLEDQVAARTAERHLLATIVETNDAFIQAADHDYRYLAINKASADEFERVFGVRPKVGDSMLDLLADRPEHQTAVKALWSRALAGEEFTVIEPFGDDALDRPVYEIKFNTLRDQDGERIGAYQFVCDVTERLRAQDQLAKAEDALRQSQKLEAIGQLTGGVAHDFNNLLTVIRGSADILRRPHLSEEKRRRYVEAIVETSERAAKLTSQLLAFARRQALDPVVFDVARCVGKLGEMLRTAVGPRIEIRIEGDCGDCCVRADRNQFEAAIINMSVNARDAMDGEGVLEIRISSADGVPPVRGHGGSEGAFVAVCIRDEGSGIDADKMQRIFEPFFTTKQVGAGTGLGLSQVFGFAKQSGGEIRAESEAGKGSAFTLYLPKADANEEVAAESAAQAFGPHSPGRGTVLIVEDNIQVGEFVSQMLGDLGYATLHAPNAQAALDLLAKGAEGIDIVFTDVVMPGMSGVELAKALRAHYPALPVVLTSGYSHVLALEGAHGFPLLHKPYSVEAVSRLLNEGLRV